MQTMSKEPKVRIKTTAKPFVCPTCRKNVTEVSIVNTAVHDGGAREYTLKSNSCGHTFKTVVL